MISGTMMVSVGSMSETSEHIMLTSVIWYSLIGNHVHFKQALHYTVLSEMYPSCKLRNPHIYTVNPRLSETKGGKLFSDKPIFRIIQIYDFFLPKSSIPNAIFVGDGCS